MLGADTEPIFSKMPRVVFGPEMKSCGPIRAIHFEALKRKRPGFLIPRSSTRYFGVRRGDLVLGVFISRNCPPEALWFYVLSRREPTFLGRPIKSRINHIVELSYPRRPFVYARFKRGDKFFLRPPYFGDVVTALEQPIDEEELDRRRVQVQRRVARALRPVRNRLRL
jgi:hypothetical protein